MVLKLQLLIPFCSEPKLCAASSITGIEYLLAILLIFSKFAGCPYKLTAIIAFCF